MTNLSAFVVSFENKEIRITPDQQISVYDVLVAFTGQSLSAIRRSWNRLGKQYPEVVANCRAFKFPGRGQQETPVTDKAGLYQILMVLPGARTDEFRQWAAGILTDPDKAADHAIREWGKEGRSAKWMEKRLQGKVKRYEFTDTLKEHGVNVPWQYAVCTDEINKPILGGTAKSLRESKGLTKKDSLRDSLDSVELMALGLAESLATREIEQQQKQGFVQCRDACKDAGGRVSRVFE